MSNAIIACRLCARRYDKGAPADPTQDDSTFVCAECAVNLGGYPQNGWINPAVLRPDARMAPAKPSLRERVRKIFKRG